MASELTLYQLKSGLILTGGRLEDLNVLDSALDALENDSTLSEVEKHTVITNAKIALAGVRGYIYGSKGL